MKQSGVKLTACLIGSLALLLYGWAGMNRLSALLIVASRHEAYRPASFTVGEIVEKKSRHGSPTHARASIGGKEYRYTLGWEEGKRFWYGNRNWEVHRNQVLTVSVREHPEANFNFSHSLDIIPRKVHENPGAHILVALLKVAGPITAGVMLLRFVLKGEGGSAKA